MTARRIIDAVRSGELSLVGLRETPTGRYWTLVDRDGRTHSSPVETAPRLEATASGVTRIQWDLYRDIAECLRARAAAGEVAPTTRSLSILILEGYYYHHQTAFSGHLDHLEASGYLASVAETGPKGTIVRRRWLLTSKKPVDVTNK
jgi:hypothetical protein